MEKSTQQKRVKNAKEDTESHTEKIHLSYEICKNTALRENIEHKTQLKRKKAKCTFFRNSISFFENDEVWIEPESFIDLSKQNAKKICSEFVYQTIFSPGSYSFGTDIITCQWADETSYHRTRNRAHFNKIFNKERSKKKEREGCILLPRIRASR